MPPLPSGEDDMFQMLLLSTGEDDMFEMVRTLVCSIRHISKCYSSYGKGLDAGGTNTGKINITSVLKRR